tara:strand:- start:215 stop:3034 length:2820 start_codon:yes stop_codon:yes gene_type:complete
MKKEKLYNPFTDKYVKINPYGKTAKKIYRYFIKKGFDPANIVPPELNYDAEKDIFKGIKTKKDWSNVRRITYGNYKATKKHPMSYLFELFKSYAGKKIKVVVKYTIDDVVQENADTTDVPPISGGYSSWWKDFSFLFIIDSESSILSEQFNEGLETKFQAQILILSMDKVSGSNYNQYFMEGVTNCLLKPIRDWAAAKLEDASSRTAKYNYSRFIKECNNFEEEFKDNGIPEDRIAEVCNKLQIGIEIDLPSTLDKNTRFIEVRSQKKPKRVFRYLNTRLNHIELNEVRNLNDYVEVSKQELIKKFNEVRESDDMLLWKECKTGITQINTLDTIYRITSEEGYRQAVKEFQEKNDLNAYKIEYYKNPELSEFLRENCHSNQAILFCSEEEYEEMDEDIVNHIDMNKSYTRAEFCKFYEGYLGKVTDFRKTDKIIGLGIYQVNNIKYNGNDIIEKLKVFHNGNAYPSPELKYYKSLGIEFDIVGGCWGSRFDIEFTGDTKLADDIQPETGMYEKEDGISHYCKWYGNLQTLNFYTRYNFDCKDLEFAKLNTYANDNANVSYNSYNGTGIIEYKSKRVYHQTHIASFISSYARINLMNQLLKIKLENIIAVQVDGIYFKGTVELDKLFNHKDKNTCAWIETEEYVCNLENEIYEFPEFRENNRIEIHTGAGGCGKTHKNLTDKGLCNVLYIAPSWKLARNKSNEYNCDVKVNFWLVDDDPDKWRVLYNNYSTIIIDEISMMTDADKELIINRFKYHKLIFCGDLGYQLPPVQSKTGKIQPEFKVDNYPVIEHTTNRRCKCPRLKRRLDYLRKLIDNEEYYLPSIKDNKVLGIELVKDFDYDEKDLIICSTHKIKNKYTEKYKDIEKYMVLENTLDHSNGDIIYHKPNGVKHELRHGFTIHSIQGETAKQKLIIDMNNLQELRMFYTALSRAEYLNQIILTN